MTVSRLNFDWRSRGTFSRRSFLKIVKQSKSIIFCLIHLLRGTNVTSVRRSSLKNSGRT